MRLTSAFVLAGCALTGALAPGQTLVGRPCLFNEYFPEWRCFPAILRDDQGNLTCGKNRLNHGGVTSAPRAAGPVCATASKRLDGTGPQFHFTYRDADGGIQDLWPLRRGEKDRWHAQQLNGGGRTAAPLAAGNPSGYFADSTYHVVYRDLDGGVRELAYDGAWRAEWLNLGGMTAAPAAAGDPVQLTLQGRRHVVYRDLDGGLQDVWFDHGWHQRTLNQGGLTQAPPAAGEPAGLEFQKTSHVLYRDRDGQVQDLWFDQGWKAQPLNGGGRTGAPAAAGDPCATVVAGSVLHVLYRDALGGIQDLAFNGSWQAQVLNNGGATQAPPARSEPFALVPPSNWEYVAYVDSHGEGQLLARLPGKAWAVVPLNAETPPGGALGNRELE